MEEIEKKPDEKTEETEEEPEESPPKNTDEGGESKTTALIDKANAAAERMEKANEKREALLKRKEEIEAKRVLGGKSTAGIPPVKKEPLSDTEYAEALERGEVNPLKEDGFI